MKKQSTTLDLTHGPVLPLMLRFCLPILLGNLMQQFYNMVDAAVVGHYVGTNALAAVGATGSLTFLVIGFVDGMCAGFCIPVAQAFGAGNNSLLKKCVWNIIYLSAAASVLLALFTSVFLGQMLDAMAFPEDIYADSFIYLRVIFLGIPATVAYNTQAGLMRAMGNSPCSAHHSYRRVSCERSPRPLIRARVRHRSSRRGSRYNHLADCLGYSLLHLHIKELPHAPCEKRTAIEKKPDGLISKRLVFSGLPMALQYSITAIGSVLLQTAINGFGSLIVASVTAANKVQSFVHLPFSTLGVTLSTWCGQNMGARGLRQSSTRILGRHGGCACLQRSHGSGDVLLR